MNITTADVVRPMLATIDDTLDATNVQIPSAFERQGLNVSIQTQIDIVERTRNSTTHHLNWAKHWIKDDIIGYSTRIEFEKAYVYFLSYQRELSVLQAMLAQVTHRSED